MFAPTRSRIGLGRLLSSLAWAVVACVPVLPDRAAAAAAEFVDNAAQSVSLEVNKGQLVRLKRPAATVFVADPAIADIQVKSPRLVYLMGRKPGQTTLYAVDRAENVLANVKVTVTHNLSRLRKFIRDLQPDGNVQVKSMDGTLILSGTVDSALESENLRRLAIRFAGEDEALINRLAVTAPNQINLRVRVAEVSRDIDKQLGFNWNIIGTIGGFSYGLTTINPFSASSTVQSLTSAFGGRSLDVNVLVDALEEEGLLKVLAEPNLTALSGETASFLAGGEFPILVPDENGRVTIEFKKFGVSLAFTPTILGSSRINLHVRPEVSQLSTENAVTLQNFVVPSLITRRAETTIELGSGQSFAIAGLLQNNVTHDISKFPGLGDVPVLGGLFKSDRFQRNESELVIIVTPYIVRPASKGKLALPTDGFVPPHDIDRFFPGGTYRRQPKAAPRVTLDRSENGLIGPVGFQLE